MSLTDQIVQAEPGSGAESAAAVVHAVALALAGLRQLQLSHRIIAWSERLIWRTVTLQSIWLQRIRCCPDLMGPSRLSMAVWPPLLAYHCQRAGQQQQWPDNPLGGVQKGSVLTSGVLTSGRLSS
jgi:hypothetical protein